MLKEGTEAWLALVGAVEEAMSYCKIIANGEEDKSLSWERIGLRIECRGQQLREAARKFRHITEEDFHMIRYEDDCVSCEECHNCGAKRRTPRIYCDECGQRLYSDDTVYMLPGKPHLCADCVLSLVPHANGEEVLPDETMDV